MLVSEKLNGYGPLNGVKVVELCEWVAAPATVRILSEMGAEIMKVEPLHGDAQRTQGPGFGCEQNETEDPTIDLNNIVCFSIGNSHIVIGFDDKFAQ